MGKKQHQFSLLYTSPSPKWFLSKLNHSFLVLSPNEPCRVTVNAVGIITLLYKKRLGQFIFETNIAGYSSGDDSGWKKEKDGSTTILHEKGVWKSRDNFFGGEPYGGSEVVFYKDKAVWMMVYWGDAEKGVDSKAVYKFLQKSLREMPKNAPFRGPKEYKTGEWRYENSWEGNTEKFKGEEKIFKGGKEVYWAGYIGGLVDQ